MRKLTTVSYVLLGFLAIEPLSAYELTKRMTLSGTRYLWPRVESRVYKEPVNLVEAGLATVTVEHQGRRARSVYTITDAGRDALRAWLDEPGAPPRVENEALLKVFYANFGSLPQLRAQLAEMRAQLEREYEAILGVLDRMADDGHPVPARAHLTQLVLADVLAQLQARAQWIRATEHQVQSWRSTAVSRAALDGTRPWAREAARAVRADLDALRAASGSG